MADMVATIGRPPVVVHFGENTAGAMAARGEAVASAAGAQESAAFAEEFSGPAYSTIGDGEAATTTGQFFRVPIPATDPVEYTRYQRTAGGSVEAAPLATTAALASSSGGDMVGFIQSGTGAKERTVQDKARETVSVLDYDADPTGSTDSTSAIQDALDSLGEVGSLYFPAGTYKINDTIALQLTDAWRGVTFRGDGPSSCVIWGGGNNKQMFHVYGASGAGWYSRILFENFQLFGNGGPASAALPSPVSTGVTGIQFGSNPAGDGTPGVCNPTVRNMLIRQLDAGIVGYYESDEASIYNNYIERFSSYGIYNVHGGSGWWVFSNHLSDGGPTATAIRTSLYSSIVDDNIIQGTEYSVGIQIDGGSVNEGSAASVRNNYIECGDPGLSYGIICYGVDTAVIENTSFHGCQGATLIALAEEGGVPCNNITIGPNRHTASGGNIGGYVAGTTSQTHCQILGRQSTNGAVDTITGAWQVVSNVAGNFGIGTGAPQKRFVVSNAGTNGFEVEPGEGDYTRVLSYNRDSGAYTPALWEASEHRHLVNGSEKTRLTATGLGIGTSSPTAPLDISGDTLRVRTAKTPASASATGNQGDWCWDSSFLYICTATNAWKRVAIASW